ncbi:MAG: GNAT family N-acetyltransferase [Candidatus Portnoybacteria bacterium]|nr:GNAT family N-acetyltransferase [Candidatus Portnoybacteria bacterium]
MSREYLQRLSEESRFLVAEYEKEIIGMGALTISVLPTGLRGHIDDVVVHEAFRGLGIGKRIMEMLIAEAQRHRVRNICLTNNSNPAQANKLYIKFGFRLLETNFYVLSYD